MKTNKLLGVLTALILASVPGQSANAQNPAFDVWAVTNCGITWGTMIPLGYTPAFSCDTTVTDANGSPPLDGEYVFQHIAAIAYSKARFFYVTDAGASNPGVILGYSDADGPRMLLNQQANFESLQNYTRIRLYASCQIEPALVTATMHTVLEEPSGNLVGQLWPYEGLWDSGIGAQAGKPTCIPVDHSFQLPDWMEVLPDILAGSGVYHKGPTCDGPDSEIPTLSLMQDRVSAGQGVYVMIDGECIDTRTGDGTVIDSLPPHASPEIYVTYGWQSYCSGPVAQVMFSLATVYMWGPQSYHSLTQAQPWPNQNYCWNHVVLEPMEWCFFECYY